MPLPEKSDAEEKGNATAPARQAKEIKDCKKKVSAAKRNLTKELTKSYEILTDGGAVDVPVLKAVHTEYINITDSYQLLLESAAETDDTLEAECHAIEAHISDTEVKYRDLLAEIRKAGEANSQLSHATDKLNSTSLAEAERDSALATLSLPHVKLDTFSGDPKQYHSFIKAFDSNVETVVSNPDVKLSRLNQYCVGDAKNAIRSAVLIGGEEGYTLAKDKLKERFGSKDLVTQRYVRDLTSGPPIVSKSDYRTFSDELTDAEMILKSLGTISRVDSQEVIEKIANRLPGKVFERFRRNLLAKKRSDKLKEYPGFTFLVAFCSDLADDNNEPIWGLKNEPTVKKEEEKKNKKKSHQVSNVNKTENKGKNVHVACKNKDSVCNLCGDSHKLWHCTVFKKLPVTTRLQYVNDSKLCINCFSPQHLVGNCDKDTVCFVKGCGMKHSMYVHLTTPTSSTDTGTDKTPQPPTPESNACIQSSPTEVQSFMPVVKAIIKGVHGNEEEIYVLLDPASSKSYALESLKSFLGVKRGDFEICDQRTLGSKKTGPVESIPHITITSTDREFELDMENVHVQRDEIPVKNSVFDRKQFPHLANLPDLPAYATEDVKISLLIGQDCADALIPLETRPAPAPKLPYAVLTPLGWTVWGSHGKHKLRKTVANVTSISAQVNKLWDIENQGTEDASPYSQEDADVIKLWDRETKVVDGRYQVPPPWKDRTPIPNNMESAKRSLEGLIKRLKKKNCLERYDKEMNVLLEKGFVEIVPEDEVNRDDGRVNYLSHHDVVKPSKPDKLRPVFNAAQKYKGTGKSMNDRFFQGPDLLNKLIAVLIRFRQHDIAIQGDIEAMYHQVALPPDDYDCFRFLWKGPDGRLVHLRFTRHLFGAVFCSASSTYALRRTVKDTENVPDVVKRAVEDDTYVDDLLTSQSSKNNKKDAITIITETPKILNRRKFPLKQMITNDPELMELIPENQRPKRIVELTPESTSRTLGLRWHIAPDEFFFHYEYTPPTSLTRRELLSTLSTIYDPLGLLGCYLLAGKLVFQEATRRGIDWDETVPDDLYDKWCEFADALSVICNLRVPRCIKPSLFDDAVITLHHFSDASLLAYGCVSYIHCKLPSGEVITNLLMSKHKVAPLKSCTIVRLELQAATLAAKLNSFLKDALTINICESYFYSDSEIVLAYIANDSRRFHVFVANRVSLIREITEVSQWYHVPGVQNPADLVTRINPKNTVDVEIWLHGPQFLRDFVHNPSNQQERDPPPLDEEDIEVRAIPLSCCSATVSSKTEGVMKIILQHSSWREMKRHTAWIIRFINYCRKTPKTGPLSADEVEQAGIRLVLYAQNQSFPEEIQYLRKHGVLYKSSNLLTLRPYLDSEGVLRAGGRLKHANIRAKNQPILAADHVMSAAIVRDTHCRGHVGVEWTSSELLQSFLIIKNRPLIKRIVSRCVTCRNLFGLPCTQLMADLPPFRVAAGGRHFQCVEIDVFGPYEVKVNRSLVKRYGLLITCMVTRAVDIEILFSFLLEFTIAY